METIHPFVVSILMVDGRPDGLRLVEKSNWVGLGIICPRGRYPEAKKREEFSNSGVYILSGRDDNEELPMIYVGEAETIRTRLNSHYSDRDFWQQAVIFTTRGEPLNKAEVKYLESRLVDLAKRYKRCHLDNSNTPGLPSLSESDQAQVEGYLREMLSLLPVFGITAFEPTAAAVVGQRNYQYQGKGWKAHGYVTNNGFAVTQGSIARKEEVRSLTFGRRSRKKLRDEGILVEQSDGLAFTADYEFSSPSLAASVVSGRNTNGREAWKDERGVTLKVHQQREVEE